MDTDEDIDDEQVYDIDREKALMAPQRIALVTKYILDILTRKHIVVTRPIFLIHLSI